MGPSARIDMAHYAKAAGFQTSSHSFTDLEKDQSGSHRNILTEQKISRQWKSRKHSLIDFEVIIGNPIKVLSKNVVSFYIYNNENDRRNSRGTLQQKEIKRKTDRIIDIIDIMDIMDIIGIMDLIGIMDFIDNIDR